MTSTPAADIATVPAGPEATDTTVDLLVVGSGTGLATALSASEQGLTSLVIEKTEYVGGSTALSGGAFWVPGNNILKRSGFHDTIERGRRYLASIVDEDAPRERWEAFLTHGPDALDMLERTTGMRFFWAKGYSDYHPEHPGGAAIGRTCEAEPVDLAELGSERARFRPSSIEAPVPMPVTGADYKWMNLMARTPAKALPRIVRRVAQGIGGMVIKREYVGTGQATAGGLFRGAITAGIPIWTRTTLKRLITDDDRVVGAEVEQDGRTVTITARRGVVLSAGGFDHNSAWRQQHQSPSLTDDLSLGSPGNAGDTIDLATGLGAATAFMDQAWWFPSMHPVKAGEQPKIMLAERSLPGSFLIDESGTRFINEAIDYMSFGQHVLGLRQQGRANDIWLVFDQKYRKSYVLASELMPGMAIPQQWYDAGVAVSADNPTELARRMGVPEEAFLSEIQSFNQDAAAGIDSSFGRGDSAYDRYYGDPTVQPNPNLRPLAGRLHAVKVVLSDLGTCGGLMTDATGHVVRDDGSQIAGLYAQGNNAANIFGRTYPGAGATIASGLVYGHIIATDAAAGA